MRNSILIVFILITSLSWGQNSDSLIFQESIKLLDLWANDNYELVHHDPYAMMPGVSVRLEGSKKGISIGDIVGAISAIEGFTGIKSKLNMSFVFLDKSTEPKRHVDYSDTTNCKDPIAESYDEYDKAILTYSLIGPPDTVKIDELRLETESLGNSYSIVFKTKYTVNEIICHNKEIYWSDRLQWKATAKKLWPTKPKLH